MYAYVRYIFDNARLVVPITNVKGFTMPSDITDFNGNTDFPVHKVYWSGDEKTRGGYYDADVIYLAEKEEDARSLGERKRLRSCGRRDRGKDCQQASQKRPAKVGASQSKRARLQVRRQQELDMLEDLDSEDDEVVPKSLLNERDEHIRYLEKEINALRKQNMCLQKALCTRVLDADKPEVEASWPVPANRESTQKDQTQHEDVTHTTMEEPCTAASEVEECFLDNGTPSSATAQVPENGSQSDLYPEDPFVGVGQAVSSNTGPTSPCLPQGCDAVDLGGGIKIPKDKWDILNRHEEEIKFVKELAVSIWGSEVLAERTFSGTLSNRAKAEGKTATFPALSPVKVQAMRSAYVNYLTSKKNLTDANEIKKKTSMMRVYVSQKISDLRRRRKT
ncbi:uncharacterized protein LOC135377135 isoform X2 [Ornithodoros turicata]|uniref:uncharacterized protein LOC135377135 isoform X2 n=1 Tax=Ornithodoros turicata TaxID=34597 RepID=UPI0031398615